jgi:hypothetical protein
MSAPAAPRADQVHDLTRRINAEPTGPTIEEELIERLRAALAAAEVE